MWVFKIYMTLLSIPPLVALAAVIAIFWFAGLGWGFFASFIALSIYGPIIALPYILPKLLGNMEKNEIPN